MRRLGLLSLLFVATGCPGVEPPAFDRLNTYPDAGPMDAEIPDADVPCTVSGVTCPEGQYCAPSGACSAIPTTCATTSDCAFDDVCRSGACVPHPRACPENGMCADPLEVCIAAGFCAPAHSPDFPFAQSCKRPDDCGPAGICRNEVCASCERDFECPGNLLCQFGGCFQQPICGGPEDCYFGNECTDAGCARSTERCVEESENDDPARATILTETYTFGVSICGDNDFDYYKLELPELTGAQITITSTRSVATIDARAANETGAGVEGSATLVLPGLTVIDLPGDNLKSTIYLEVTGRDASGEYAIDVQFHPIGCAGDERDLYGDGFRTSPALVNAGEAILTACAGDDDWMAIDLHRGDALQVAIAWDPATRANLDVEIYDSTGMNPIASATSDTGSFELVTSERTTADERLFIRVFAEDAPTFGAPYAIEIAPKLARRFGACDAARELDLSSVDNVSTTGSLRGALDLGAPNCGSSSVDPARGDVLLRVLPPPPPSVITASVRQLAGSTSTISIALLSECSEDLSVEGCEVSAQPYRPSTVSVLRDSADPVWLFISTDGTNDQIDFALDVRVDTPGANDICANAIDLPASATLNAGTIGATNDVRIVGITDCGLNGYATGPDRFYSMRLEGGERAALELSGEPGGFLWISTDCTMMTATCTVSEEITYYAPARVALAPTQTTTYAIAVDGLGDDSSGAYLLRAVREPQFECFGDTDCVMPERCDNFTCVPIAANDTCATAERVVFADNRARVSGSIGAASSNYQLSCGANPGQPDVVYSVDVPAAISRLVVRVADAEFDPVVGIRRTGAACELGPDLACNDDENLPARVYLSRATLANPLPGTYAIIVDAYLGEGAFTLELELVP